MVKVITYGTYDLMHEGHIRLLERAKALGDYLIVGVTSDDFDKARGKINVQQSLIERIEAIKETGLADEIIIEEYEGQKIDDIKRFSVDIFTVGSDWVGKFDYLSKYCEVIYLPRTEGISSTEIRANNHSLKVGMIGITSIIEKNMRESKFVNGVDVVAVTLLEKQDESLCKDYDIKIFCDYEEMLKEVDAVFISTVSTEHYVQIEKALQMKKHVLCEAPIYLEEEKTKYLFELAKKNGVILMEAIKTAYAMAYNRLLLLANSKKIGKIISVDATCTSLVAMPDDYENVNLAEYQNSMSAWGPTALLPILQILGTDYESKNFYSWYLDKEKKFDLFTKINLKYKDAVASVKVGKGVKSEGELIISGTKGYIYVPAPWWKTDYFEIRFENQEQNQRHFYQLDGEGIRYEWVAFAKSIQRGESLTYISAEVSKSIAKILEDFNNKINVSEIIAD